MIFANSMVAEEIAEENKERKLNTLKQNQNDNRCVHVDTSESKHRDRSTNTREQVAKLSGVGTGTVARYEYKITSRRLIREVIVFQFFNF